MKRLLTIILVAMVALAVVMVGCEQREDEVVPEAPQESLPEEEAPPDEEAPPEVLPMEPTVTEPESPPEPKPGTGGSAVGNLWQITVENAYEKTQILSPKGEEMNPKPGYKILAVDIELQNLDQTKIIIPPSWFTVTTEEGETFEGALGEYQGRDIAIAVAQMLTVNPEDPLSVPIFFLVNEETIDQVFELQFQGLTPIPFSVD